MDAVLSLAADLHAFQHIIMKTYKYSSHFLSFIENRMTLTDLMIDRSKRGNVKGETKPKTIPNVISTRLDANTNFGSRKFILNFNFSSFLQIELVWFYWGPIPYPRCSTESMAKNISKLD